MARLQEAELTRIHHTTAHVLQQTTADVQYIAADVDYDDSVVTRMQCEIEDLKALAVKGGPHCMTCWLWRVCAAWCVLAVCVCDMCSPFRNLCVHVQQNDSVFVESQRH